MKVTIHHPIHTQDTRQARRDAQAAAIVTQRERAARS